MFKINNVELKYTVVSNAEKETYNFPHLKEPVIVFAGRSNVGKSSVINSLVGKKIAFTSKQPGRTRQINYYLINSKFYFVDLPGYGYAQVDKRTMEEWRVLLDNFFLSEKNIKLVTVIIDIRRNILDADLKMIGYLNNLKINYCILLNKADLLSNQEIIAKRELYLFTQKYGCEEVFHFSARTGMGKNVFLKYLSHFI